MCVSECVSVNWEKEREGGKEREREPGLCSFCTVAAVMLMCVCECVSVNWEKEREGGRERERERESLASVPSVQLQQLC